MISKTLLHQAAPFAIFLFFAQPVAAEQTKPRATDSSQIDRSIVKQMDEAGIAGLGAAIIVNRKLIWMKGYGFADREQAVPFTPDTVMNIGSISKTFTGVALMHAVQDGKLALDVDINAYLPFKIVNPYYPTEKITLRQLATHTSGITDRWSVYKDAYHYGGAAPTDLGEFLRSYFCSGGKLYSRDNFLSARPGTYREYSNIGAGLAGYIVERALGEKLPEYTKRTIFGPLGMDNTGWSLDEIDSTKHATLYVAQAGMTIPIYLYEITTYPDGGVRTSISDLAKFFIALLNGGVYEGTRILDKRHAEEMLRFQYTASDKPRNVDLHEENSGLFWATKMNVTRIGHGGSDPGIRTAMLSNLSRDVGVIFFTNTSLSGEGARHYATILRELWNYAETLKSQEHSPTNR